MKSTDEKNWEYVGKFLSKEMPGGHPKQRLKVERRHLLPRISSSSGTSGCSCVSAIAAAAATTWETGRMSNSPRTRMAG